MGSTSRLLIRLCGVRSERTNVVTQENSEGSVSEVAEEIAEEAASMEEKVEASATYAEGEAKK